MNVNVASDSRCPTINRYATVVGWRIQSRTWKTTTLSFAHSAERWSGSTKLRRLTMNKLCTILFIGCFIGCSIAVTIALCLPTTKARPDLSAPPSPATVPVTYQRQEPMPGVTILLPLTKWSGRWVDTVMNVSAYCSCSVCCGTGSPGITASGSRIDDVSYFLAAPPEYPYGTVMRVPGYAGGRSVVVLDRGGAIKGNRLDTYHETHALARKFGRQTLHVEIWKAGE